MSLVRQLMALIAQRNAEPGGWDHDRAAAEPVAAERCPFCDRSYGGIAHGGQIGEHPAACPGPPPAPDMPRLVDLDATPDHHPEHPNAALAPEPDAPSIQAIRNKGPIGDQCNTGDHYGCGGCGCTCHPPLTWST